MEQEKQYQKNWSEQIYNIVRDLIARWHIICLFGVIVAIGADLVQTLNYEPVYQTEMSVALKAGETQDSEEVAEALDYILSSNVFLNKIAADLGVDTLNGTFKTEPVKGTNVIKISATADSPQNAYWMLYRMKERYQEVTSLVIGDSKMQIIDKMKVPLTPYNQINHFLNLLLFGAIGAFFMIAVFTLFSYMRDTIKERREVEEKLQIHLLADVASEAKVTMRGGKLRRKKAILITQFTTSFLFVETFKRLRTRFEVQAHKKGYKIVVVSSTMENEGKSSIVVNLALALAQQGRKVLLMDADLGKPAIGRILDIETKHGLDEALRGEITMDEAIYHHERAKLDIVFSTDMVSDSTNLLEGEILPRWFEAHRDEYDYILIDTPPSNYMSAAMITAQYADAVLLVVRQDFTPVALLNRTIEQYLAQDTPIIGCVLNRSMPLVGKKQKTYSYKGGGRSGADRTVD